MPKAKYQYSRVTQFYETDGMNIIHHANYLRFFEEARLQFLAQVYGGEVGSGSELLGKVNYPLVHCQIDYKSQLNFNEEILIDVEVSIEGAKLVFDYQIGVKSLEKPIAFGKTIHAAFDMEKQRACRIPAEVLAYITS